MSPKGGGVAAPSPSLTVQFHRLPACAYLPETYGVSQATKTGWWCDLARASVFPAASASTNVLLSPVRKSL